MYASRIPELVWPARRLGHPLFEREYSAVGFQTRRSCGRCGPCPPRCRGSRWWSGANYRCASAGRRGPLDAQLVPQRAPLAARQRPGADATASAADNHARRGARAKHAHAGRKFLRALVLRTRAIDSLSRSACAARRHRAPTAAGWDDGASFGGRAIPGVGTRWARDRGIQKGHGCSVPGRDRRS